MQEMALFTVTNKRHFIISIKVRDCCIYDNFSSDFIANLLVCYLYHKKKCRMIFDQLTDFSF